MALLALAFRPCSSNLGQAHNGFLTAALMGAALVQLDRRPGSPESCFASWPTSRNSDC